MSTTQSSDATSIHTRVLTSLSTLSIRRPVALVAPWRHPVVSAVLAWGAICLFLTITSGVQPADSTSMSGILLVPGGAAIALIGGRLAGDDRTEKRDRLPWRLMAMAGLAMIATDLMWPAYAPQAGSFSRMAMDAISVVPAVLLACAAALFRAGGRAGTRSRSDVGLDIATVVLVSAAMLWFLVFDRLAPAGPGEQLARLACGVLAVLAIAGIARIALRPTIGISTNAATVIVLGGSAAIIGLAARVLTPDAAAGTTGAAAVGQGSLVLLRVALIVGAWMEVQARAGTADVARKNGPSPLFYSSVVIGSAPLILMALDLGARDAIMITWLVAMSAIVVVRQLFTARAAIAADSARQKTEARFGWLVRNSSDFIMAVDAGGSIDYISPSVERLLHVPAATLLGAPLAEICHPEDAHVLEDIVGEALRQPGCRASGEWRIRQANGTWLPVETVASSGTGDYDTTGVVLNTRDLRERKALEQKLTFQAFHDPLTRLANRSLFRERVEHAIDRRHAPDLAVLFIDLDNFKTINDSLGHAAGDHVLVETAHRIRSTLRTEDTAARLGGDEFAVLLEDSEVTGAARVAERIRAALGTPFWVTGQEVYISASIGIAVGQPGDTTGELLRNADVAMYTAKGKGKSRFEIFEPAMHDAVVARLGLEAELRRALERQEFVVQYQPIVRLETGAIIGAEALVRWNHPTRGMIPPMEFIPLAEETGLVVPLGGWVLRQACSQLAEWQKLRGGGEPFVMNVNLSSRQLVRDAIADEVAAAVDESGIRASWLVLEVTETVLMADPAAAATALGHIRDLGVRVALDDFGSGYSSLSHLRRFPIDIVKIDKSFVDDVAQEGVESAIARGIIELGRAMHLETVAEGIEMAEQAEMLRTLGCDLGQGYLFARPLDASALSERLSAETANGAGAGSRGEPAPAASTESAAAATTRRRTRSSKAA